MNAHIKSKQRVSDHGEVFTQEREVAAMLDLVKHETERIESRFLEPACGTGNFLTEVLRRKLDIVEQRYRRSQVEFERNSVVAVGSIYGIDLLDDNVELCRENLFRVFDDRYTARYKRKAKQGCRDTVRFILNRNIVWGNALDLKTAGESREPIVFSEWSTFQRNYIIRKDWQYQSLINPEHMYFSDNGTAGFEAVRLRTYEPVHFLEVATCWG